MCFNVFMLLISVISFQFKELLSTVLARISCGEIPQHFLRWKAFVSPSYKKDNFAR